MPEYDEIYVHEIPLLLRAILGALGFGALGAIFFVFLGVKTDNPFEIAQWFIALIVIASVLLFLAFGWIERFQRPAGQPLALSRFASRHNLSIVRGESEDAPPREMRGRVLEKEIVIEPGEKKGQWTLLVSGHHEWPEPVTIQNLAFVTPLRGRHFGLDGRVISPARAIANAEVRGANEKNVNALVSNALAEQLEARTDWTALRAAPNLLEIVLETRHAEDALEWAYQTAVLTLSESAPNH